jgi:hypothetical protein
MLTKCRMVEVEEFVNRATEYQHITVTYFLPKDEKTNTIPKTKPQPGNTPCSNAKHHPPFQHHLKPLSPLPPTFLSLFLLAPSTLKNSLSFASSSNSLSTISLTFIICSSVIPFVLTTTLGAPSKYLRFSVARSINLAILASELRLSWRLTLCRSG